MEDRIRKNREDRELVDLPVGQRDVRGGAMNQEAACKRSASEEQAYK